MLLGQHRHRVGADLVGHIAVCGDAIGADHHRVDLTLLEEISGHVVGDERAGDALLLQLPGGQPGALQERTGLVGEHVNRRVALEHRADDAERRAVTGRRQSPGVAVGEDARSLGEERRRVLAHGDAHGHVLVENLLGAQPSAGCGSRPHHRVRYRSSPAAPGPSPGYRPWASWRKALRRPASRSRFRSSWLVAADCLAASAIPMAVATPMAGAPRITIVLMESPTSCQVV